MRTDGVNKGIFSLYWHICWPAALEGLLIVMLTSVDLVMVSSLGTAAVAAVGIFSQPKMVILCVSRSLSVTVTAVVAKRFGKGETQGLSAFLKQTTLLTFLAAFVLFILTEGSLKSILLLAGAEAEYLPLALSYGWLANINLLFYAPALVINGGLTGLGQTKSMLISNVAGNLVNVGLNAVFIYVFALGVAGAGLATAIGGGVTLLCSVLFAVRENCLVSLWGRNHWKLTAENFKEVRRYFSGIFLEQGFERIGMFLYSVMTAMLGMTDFAIHNICMTLCDVFYSFGQGFSKSSLALSGRFSGERNGEHQRGLLLAAKILPGACALAAAAGYVAFAPQLMGFYSKDTLVIERGVVILLFVAATCIPSSQSLSLSGILRGIGDTNYVARYSFWSIAVIRPILTWVLCFGFHLGLSGAWMALLFDQTMRWAFAAYRTRSKVGQSG